MKVSYLDNLKGKRMWLSYDWKKNVENVVAFNGLENELCYSSNKIVIKMLPVNFLARSAVETARWASELES